MSSAAFERGMCIQCGDPAFVNAAWMVGGNPQEADLCEQCASELWRVFGRTTHFNFSQPEAV